jgi:hypothetical protein
MAKTKRVWRRGSKANEKPKADSKASVEPQMSDEELEAQARVHGVIRTSVAAHGGLGVPWNMSDIPPPDPPPPEADPQKILAHDIRLMGAALGGFGPIVLERPKAKAKD